MFVRSMWFRPLFPCQIWLLLYSFSPLQARNDKYRRRLCPDSLHPSLLPFSSTLLAVNSANFAHQLCPPIQPTSHANFARQSNQLRTPTLPVNFIRPLGPPNPPDLPHPLPHLMCKTFPHQTPPLIRLYSYGHLVLPTSAITTRPYKKANHIWLTRSCIHLPRHPSEAGFPWVCSMETISWLMGNSARPIQFPGTVKR